MKNPWDSLSIAERAELYFRTEQGECCDLVAPMSWNELTQTEQDAIYRVLFMKARQHETVTG
jgi:hypothetical protein